MIFVHKKYFKMKTKTRKKRARSVSLSVCLLVSAILMKSVDTIYSLSLDAHNAHIYAGFLWKCHVSCGNVLSFSAIPFVASPTQNALEIIDWNHEFGQFFQPTSGRRERFQEEESGWKYCSTAQRKYMYSIRFLFYRSFCFSDTIFRLPCVQFFLLNFLFSLEIS